MACAKARINARPETPRNIPEEDNPQTLERVIEEWAGGADPYKLGSPGHGHSHPAKVFPQISLAAAKCEIGKHVGG